MRKKTDTKNFMYIAHIHAHRFLTKKSQEIVTKNKNDERFRSRKSESKQN